jgi:hypothetical protein
VFLRSFGYAGRCCWSRIIAILTFHFDLVHVSGTHHGPDGLSRRPCQKGDDEEIDDKEDFEDWIDRLHGFMHQINVIDSRPPSKTQISIFSQTIDFSGEDIDTVINPNTDSYDLIPRSEQVKTLDARLLKVYKWLQDLIRPDDLSDSEYTTFIHYFTEFFIDDNQLWRKHPQGAHKLIISPDYRFNIICIAHDSLGHKAYFTTKAHIDQ